MAESGWGMACQCQRPDGGTAAAAVSAAATADQWVQESNLILVDMQLSSLECLFMTAPHYKEKKAVRYRNRPQKQACCNKKHEWRLPLNNAV